MKCSSALLLLCLELVSITALFCCVWQLGERALVGVSFAHLKEGARVLPLLFGTPHASSVLLDSDLCCFDNALLCFLVLLYRFPVARKKQARKHLQVLLFGGSSAGEGKQSIHRYAYARLVN